MSTGHERAPEPVDGSDESEDQNAGWQRFDPHIVAVWRMRTILVSAIVLVVFGPLSILLPSSQRWTRQIGAIALGIVVLTTLTMLVRLLTLTWRYRLARWRLGYAFVEVESGWWRTVSERVPIDRVHTMTVVQGPFLRRYSIFDIDLHASGGTGMLKLTGVGSADVAEVRRHLEFDR